jgi:pimeloyl-ACP methyl ester carboxylesterase
MTVRMILGLLVVVLALTGCQLGPPVSSRPQLKRTQTNSVTLTFLEQGKGTPVVFVHGAMSDHRVWDPYRDAVSLRYRFVAYSQRYFGTDPWPDNGANFSAATHAADLGQLIRSLGAGPVHLVSWSYGGLVATMAALEHPELVRTLTHYEPAIQSLIAGTPEGQAALAERATLLAPALAAATSGDADKALRLFIEGVFALPDRGFDRQPESLRTMALDNARTVLPLAMAPPPAPLTCEQVGTIKSPTLVIKGANTHAWYSMMAETLAHCVPDAQLVVIPAGKHDAPIRHAAAISDVLRNFLDSH